ncbi:hypothetical protein ACT6ND_06825 [Pseudochrobactrum asaccharolyticum]
MQKVGHHLHMQAKLCADLDRDVFARSAYNRYYYSSFLIIREAFNKMDPSWSKTAHKSYPETLKGEVKKRLKRAYSRAEKIKDNEATRDITNAQRAILQLCKIITEAYGIRVVADYKPETQVVFLENNTFSLNSISIEAAYKWKDDVQTLSKIILTAWKHVDD